MITFYGHVGAALIIAGLLKLNPIITIIGGMLPDIDALLFLKSKEWRKFHRKITHSIFFLLIPLIFFIIPQVMASLFFGILSHLIMDSITYPGIKPFYPFNKRKFFIFKTEKSIIIDDTPIIAIKNWFRNPKQIMIESVVVIIGLITILVIH